MLEPGNEPRIRSCSNARIYVPLVKHHHKKFVGIQSGNDLFHREILGVGVGFVGERRSKDRNHPMLEKASADQEATGDALSADFFHSS